MRSPRVASPGCAVARSDSAISISVMIAARCTLRIISLHWTGLVITARAIRPSFEKQVFHQGGDREDENENDEKPNQCHHPAHSTHHVHHVVHHGTTSILHVSCKVGAMRGDRIAMPFTMA